MARGHKTSTAVFPLAPTFRSPASELGPRANRTIAKILEASRAIFLTRGYSGTTIDEIARVAGLSRTSFYTYFPTKRDVLLTLGADSARASEEMVRQLERFADGWSQDSALGFINSYFDLLDEHGSFVFAWTQAAHEDDEIRTAGMVRHLRVCRDFGRALGAVRGAPFDDPTAVGLNWFSMLERSWSYCQLYDAIDSTSVKRELAEMLVVALRNP